MHYSRSVPVVRAGTGIDQMAWHTAALKFGGQEQACWPCADYEYGRPVSRRGGVLCGEFFGKVSSGWDRRHGFSGLRGLSQVGRGGDKVGCCLTLGLKDGSGSRKAQVPTLGTLMPPEDGHRIWWLGSNG